MTSRRLALAAMAFGVLALGAGALQAWAFASSQYPRHAVLAVFALSVGVCVLVAAVRAFRRASRDRPARRL
ncbi:hypothetical protein [[Mycobacterium] wendilense]|uniref:Uncharacterized protein n=1 Tax=[Mycobacterium] wendilense TaxID=3064284 RepID=A0ABN9NZA3_9MYCO|nr:hypothetical protein [Mycolicibacterium sp. MU0050]CAJ1580334.1 hypothetical protein MU0050_000991 [Mycolicibacterium sp. MU0050]